MNTSSAIGGMNHHQKTDVVAKSPAANIQKSNISMHTKIIVAFDLSFCSVRSATTQVFIHHSNFIILDNETDDSHVTFSNSTTTAPRARKNPCIDLLIT